MEKLMVPKVGVEPTWPEGHTILSRARLPIPPLRHGRSNNSTTSERFYAASIGAEAARTFSTKPKRSQAKSQPS